MKRLIKRICMLFLVGIFGFSQLAISEDQPLPNRPSIPSTQRKPFMPAVQNNSVLPSRVMNPSINSVSDPSVSNKIPLSDKNTISLDYTNANLGDVVKAIGYSFNVNIVIVKDITGKVSAHLKELSLDDALTAILDINGYGFSHKGNIVYITAKDDVEQVAESLPLSFLSLKEANTLLGGTIKKYKATLQQNDDANTLIVTCNPADLASIKEILRKIDVPPMQVLIEAKIINIDKQVSDNMDAAIGINFINSASKVAGSYVKPSSASSALSSTTTSGSSTPGSSLLGGLTPFSTAVSTDGSGFAISKSSGSVFSEGSINALVKNHKARVLASPSIATLNGHEASIIIGQKISISTSTSTAGGTGGSVVSQTTSSYVDIGTKLKVTPIVSPDGWITMKIEPEVSSVKDTSVANPPIETNSAKTEVRVRNNEMIIIGGLKNRTESNDTNGTPFLKDIPILGWLFKSHSTSDEIGELTVLITPHIIPMGPNIQSRANLSSGGENAIVDNILNYTETLEQDKTKDPTINRYLAQQQIKYFKMLLTQFPQSSKVDFCLYKMVLIYAKEFDNCVAANEAFMELKSTNTESPYLGVTEALVSACKAIKNQKK